MNEKLENYFLKQIVDIFSNCWFVVVQTFKEIHRMNEKLENYFLKQIVQLSLGEENRL
jgi:hypothetical protein